MSGGMYQAGYVEIYDLVMRSRGKDYAGQAERIAALVRAQNPNAKSMLDVACGTGLHLPFLQALFDHVEGIDVSEDMLAFAKRRAPDVRLRQGDMREFDLGRRFDAIACMFAAPHLSSDGELDTMFACLARHLSADGVVVIEPWYAPDAFTPGYVASDVVRTDGRAIARLSHSTYDGDNRDKVHMVVHYAVADAVDGIRSFTDTVELSLFTPGQYERALTRAGFRPHYVSDSRFAWGLWVGQLQP